LTLTLPSCATHLLSHDTPLPARVKAGQLHGQIVDMRTLHIVPFDAMVRALAAARVIAVGEEHYHPEIQAFELQLLQALAQQRPGYLALAMEFLERDAQQAVDAYTAATIDLDMFHQRLEAAPSFQRYYTPLVIYARQNRMPTLAMNAPRHIARRVAKVGLQATLEELDATDRAYVPEHLPEISARYRTYFLDAVASHHPVEDEQAVTFTEASFLKDATMAHVLSRFLEQHPQFTVFAIAGRFHLDYGIAIPALIEQQQPYIPTRRITTMAVSAGIKVDLHHLRQEGIADYVRFFPPAPRVATPRAFVPVRQTWSRSGPAEIATTRRLRTGEKR
jgi:uncharacterized iron-regulated protein